MINWTKPLKTKSGCKAQLIHRLTNANPEYYQPMVVIIENEDGIQEVDTFTEEGTYFLVGESRRDLINV